MPGPDRIHVNLNASEGYELFQEQGIAATSHDVITPDHIKEVLGAQVGRLFRLIGAVEDSSEKVFLRIDGGDEKVLAITSTGGKLEDRFQDTYIIATEPPPRIQTPHGDYLFDLVRSDASGASQE